MPKRSPTPKESPFVWELPKDPRCQIGERFEGRGWCS